MKEKLKIGSICLDIFNDCCLNVLDELIKNNIKVDAVICDLPYGTTNCAWDVVIPFDKMWTLLNNITKDNGAIVLFGTEPFSSYLRLSNIKHYKHEWIWEKSRPTGIANKKSPMKKHENILVFCKKSLGTFNKILEDKEYMGKKSTRKPWATFNTGKSSLYLNKTDKKFTNLKRNPTSILKFPSCPNYPKNLHPTQKPVPLIEYLIKTYTNEYDVILDFAAGSMTTGIACIEQKRNCILIEKDISYYNIGLDRIENFISKIESEES